MASGPDKKKRCRELALFFHQLCVADRTTFRLWLVGDSVQRIDRHGDEILSQMEFSGRIGLEAAPGRLLGLRPRSIRIVISDFLFAGDARPLVSACGRGGAALFFLQTLGQEEIRPEVSSGQRLTDVESGAALDLVLDRHTIGQYQGRLAAHEAHYRQELRRHGGSFSRLNTSHSLKHLARHVLLPCGLLSPRAAGGVT